MKKTAFSNKILTWKTMSRSKSDCMILMNIFLAFKISNQIFRSIYRLQIIARFLNTTMWPKNSDLWHSVPRYRNQNLKYCINSWRTRWYQSLPWTEYFWRFFDDFSGEKLRFSPEKSKWRHGDVISSQNYKIYQIQTKNIAESLHQRNFCKKPHVKSSFRSEEDRARSHRHTHIHTHRSFY